MMKPTSHPELARAAAKLLRDAPVPAAVPPREGERARAVAAIGDAIAGAKSRRIRWQAVAGLLAAAAAFGGVFAGMHGLRGHDNAAVVATSGSVIVKGASDARLSPGSEVAAPDGPGALTLGSGTRVSLEGGAAVSVVEEGQVQRFALDRGAARWDVAKLATGERFIIRTADAEIEVHGTSFRVGPVAAPSACTPQVSTGVDVYEGVVTVRSGGTEIALRAGDSWPRCSAAPPAQSAVPMPVTPEPAAPASPPAAQPLAAPPASTLAASTLGAQNELFADAVTASRMGDGARAAALFDQFRRTYPGSPLAESAMAQRMKLLGRSAAGRAAAREYLARYPSGFASADAKRIVEASP